MEKTELTTLVARAQSGDQNAMEELLRTAHTSVSYQCRKLLRDPRDAEDMTQEVLLAVYTKLDQLTTPAAFWGWLNTMTANRCVNTLKRSHVELQFAEDEEGHSVLDDLEELDEQQVPDKALDNAETTRMIEEIVNGLPEAQRICTLMYYYDEMSVKDIAEALGVPENTVKSRLNYARKAVKEKVLDYEKQGVKLYGLSPLPFLLFFLRRAAAERADGTKAAFAAKRAMELGAAAGTTGTAGTTAMAGTTSTAGIAAAGGAATGGLSVKLIAGLLAITLAVGGAAGAAVFVIRNAQDSGSSISEIEPEDEDDEEEEPDASESEEISDELIPADRLALLNNIKYYGDPAQCRMTVNQATAFAQVIDMRTTEVEDQYNNGAVCAALIDIGEGNPILALACGSLSDDSYYGGGDPNTTYETPIRWFYGKMEIWQYIDGQAELLTTTHGVHCKEGVGLVCHTRVGGTNDENDNIYPMEQQAHYLDFTEEVYLMENGTLSRSPVASALVETDLMGYGSSINGQSMDEMLMWQTWEQQWGEGGQTDVRISGEWPWEMGLHEDGSGWINVTTGYDAVIGGYVDNGSLNIEDVSPGAEAADVLRQCAGGSAKDLFENLHNS